MSVTKFKFVFDIRYKKVWSTPICAYLLGHVVLKGSVSLDFWHSFLDQINSIWAPYEQWTGKNSFANFFRFREDIRENSRKNTSRWLRWHGVIMVVDYADMMSAWFLTSRTPCQRGFLLCWHRVSLSIDYADTCQQSCGLFGHCVYADTR